MNTKYITFIFAIINSSLIFIRRVFVINKFRFPLISTQIVSIFLTLMSGVTFWISINSLRGNIWLQVISGFISTILSWSSMIYLVNDEYVQLPTRQQLVSLLFYILTDLSVLMQARIVIGNSM